MKAATKIICFIVCVFTISCFVVPPIIHHSPFTMVPSNQPSPETHPQQKPLTTNLEKKLYLPLLVAGNEKVYNMPYWRWLPTVVVDSRKRYPISSLSVDPLLVENGQTVTVKWINIPPQKNSPWLGLYCPATSHSDNFIDYWFVKELSSTPDHGIANVTLYNIREDCQFRFFLNDTYAELIAESDVVKFVGGKGAPLHGHLALTGKANEMRVMWTSGTNQKPIVEYGPCHNCYSSDFTSERTQLSLTATGTSSTYTAKNMCGPPANQTIHFRHPGYLHNVLLTGLKPNVVYCYRFGSEGNLYSLVKHFKTSLPPGEQQPFYFIVYGDMDISLAPGADTTSVLVQNEVENGAAFVLHIGDLSYAEGFAYRWDEFMTLIEPISSRVPYMVSVGNHEQDTMVGGRKDPSGVKDNGFHPVWGNYGHDSGGECGVPLHYRFHMPDNGNHVWWYSFEYGLVHLTQLSSEHNFTRGSPQYLWLEEDLKSIDYKRTPWIIVTIHRPLYTIENYPSDTNVVEHIREALEDILCSYKVDLLIAGHYHSYQRSCKVYHNKCSDNGIVNIVVGSAGADFDTAEIEKAMWLEHFEYSFGYGRISVNKTALHWEFVRNVDRVVSDSLWSYK